GCNISWDTTLRIAAEIPNIIGIKEASGNLNQCVKILRDRPEGFLVISGDDALTLPLLACGGDGVISVVANAFPKEFVSMVACCLENNYIAARSINQKMADIIETIFADGSPSGVKAALEVLDLCQSHVRLPLVKVNKATFNNISSAIQMFETSKISVL
ncbi:MAG: 4-hydroxy-tetrahydrodipicolinate synthase, partial [Bacteroidales bacterium]|nr:4-hydroxy-tetrahydrodipicolinate synthase [Bacteroidales bacterium]